MKTVLGMARLAATVSLALCICVSTSIADDAGQQVVATVDGADVTQSELDAEFLIRQIPSDKQKSLRKVVLHDLISRRLLSTFLDQRKAPVPEPELEAKIELLKRAVEAGGQGSLADVLAKRGLTEEQLRAQLSLPLRWKAFVRRTVTDQELRDYFEAHRVEFDGTQVRARQIVIGLPTRASEPEWLKAEETLKQVRMQIVEGKLSFKDAAQQYSTSPKADLGGDLGFINYHGRVGPELAAAAFALKPEELSEVFRSPVGVHLVQVTERKPGEFSLEDVREQVWQQKANDLWNEQVTAARKTATIHITTPKSP
jgi:parvulin-like peptidyl-prolyl isomerase